MEHSQSQHVNSKPKPVQVPKAVSAPGPFNANSPSRSIESPSNDKSDRIRKIKENSHVTIIQSRWRGRMARLMDKAKLKIAPAPPPLAFDQIRLRRTGTDYTLTKRSFVQTKQNTKLQRIPVERLQTVEFYIDGAGGLPYSSTLTRVSAKLLTSDKQQLGDATSVAAASYSHPDSDYASPAYSYHASFSGATLTKDATFVCRVDTLESPSLLPRCVGYAALKLCADASGEAQPSSTRGSAFGCCLNAGEFLLPLHYGKIPTEGPLTESVIQALPQIEGAFLRVRLFDKQAERSSEPALFVVNYNSPLSPRSVAALVTQSHRFAQNYHLPPLPGPDAVTRKILTEEPLVQAERAQLTKAFQDWFPSTMPATGAMKEFIDPRFMLQYQHTSGCMLALDCLYNMPLRKNLIKVAQQSATVQAILAGYSRGWDDKLNLFKTSFRYLPGAAPANTPPIDARSLSPDLSIMVPGKFDATKAGLNLSSLQTDRVETILDDASVQLLTDSQESFPHYTDDFSCTAGLQLNPAACILVLVTPVDVLTTSQPLKEGEDYPVHAEHQPFTPKVPTAGKTSGFEAMEEVIYAQRQMAKEERRKKLEGLIGIHVGHNDRRACMWGLLPVHVECPVTVKVPQTAPPAVVKLDRVNGQGSGSSVGGSVHAMTLSGKSGAGRFFPAGGPEPTAESYVTPTNHPCFVNAGTHQVPLFEGLPPDELMRAPDPMAWLCQNLTEQNQREMNEGFGILSFLFGSSMKGGSDKSTTNSHGPETPGPETTVSVSEHGSAASRRKKNRRPPTALLSTGACAMVRLTDSRLSDVNCESLVKDFAKKLDETTLRAVVSARAGYVVESGGSKQFKVDHRKFNKILSRFSYFALKHADHRSIRSAIPSTIDPPTLIDEINQKYSQTLFHMLNS